MTTDKTKPFSNEIEVNLIYVKELTDRAAYFEEISTEQHKSIVQVLEDTKKHIHNILNS